MFWKRKTVIAKFSDLKTEELENKLLCLDNKSFGKFITSSIDYDKGFISEKLLEKEKNALMQVRKETLKNTINRINSIEEQYDGYKLPVLIAPFMTTLLIVLGNQFFFRKEITATQGLTSAAVTFLLLLLTYSYAFIKIISLGKRGHSKLIFFKYVLEECLDKKKEKEKNISYNESG
ncbi:hypothetical protein COE99_09405 [Bacillus toyonensis]|uniref:hypothetical protein n=1 Tax=Bacillus toyonensis TaxID=155322 RepID=UPI000BFE4544|nr:hypothetical protein [Bacillus toyonensis]PHC09918.1 hypothetical protein COE99_09405 [Bacillus toyonensis]